VLNEYDELDELIARHASGWSLDRIAPLERSILRVALHELRSRPDVPAEVAIDEAVEAAKELCSAETPGFVNGILGAVHREEVAPR
jgi:N utilization substance protein B